MSESKKIRIANNYLRIPPSNHFEQIVSTFLNKPDQEIFFWHYRKYQSCPRPVK